MPACRVLVQSGLHSKAGRPVGSSAASEELATPGSCCWHLRPDTRARVPASAVDGLVDHPQYFFSQERGPGPRKRDQLNCQTYTVALLRGWAPAAPLQSTKNRAKASKARKRRVDLRMCNICRTSIPFWNSSANPTKGRACNLDSICADFYRCFQMLPKVARANVPADFRPIASLRLLCKTFSSVLLRRIEATLDAHQPEEQHGFRKGRRVKEHLLTANLIIDKSFEQFAHVDY